MEHNGAERARPFVEAAGATFPTVVDEHGVTAEAFGFKLVPNGVLVDPSGVVRYAKFGGFSIDNPGDVAVVEHFIAGQDPGPSPELRIINDLTPTERDLVDARLRLGQLLVAQGRRDDAVREWRAALRIDPENLVIRKQIWAALYPEKFFPTIDFDWQKGQLAREREDEVSEGVCGPDGCRVPTRAGTPA